MGSRDDDRHCSILMRKISRQRNCRQRQGLHSAGNSGAQRLKLAAIGENRKDRPAYVARTQHWYNIRQNSKCDIDFCPKC